MLDLTNDMIFLCVGITSKHTSYIAIDESGQQQLYTMPMQERQIPNQLPYGSTFGFGSSRQRFRDSSVATHYSLANFSPQRSLGACFFGSSSGALPKHKSVHPAQQQQMQPQMQQQQSFSFGSSTPTQFPLPPLNYLKGLGVVNSTISSQVPSPSFGGSQLFQPQLNSQGSTLSVKSDRVILIISHQNFDGSFSMSDALCQSLRVSYADIISGLFQVVNLF